MNRFTYKKTNNTVLVHMNKNGLKVSWKRKKSRFLYKRGNLIRDRIKMRCLDGKMLIMWEFGRDLQINRRLKNNVLLMQMKFFFVYINDARTFIIKGDTDYMLQDAKSSDFGIKMMVLLEGGTKSHFGLLFTGVKNYRFSYLVKYLLDAIMGVCYRIGPKKCMDYRVFLNDLKR